MNQIDTLIGHFGSGRLPTGWLVGACLALRNALILLLSQQDETAVSTSGGRDLLRAQALVEVNEILEREEGEALIDDLMFTNFVVQR